MVRVEYKKSKRWLWIGLLVISIVAGAVFVFPTSFSKTEYYTEVVKYEVQESYQEVVNRDNCDATPACVCSDHGGFLWLTCVQCSCTSYRTVLKEKIVLRERNVDGSTTLFKSWTHSTISQSEAMQIAKSLLDFIERKEGGHYSITGANRVSR